MKPEKNSLEPDDEQVGAAELGTGPNGRKKRRRCGVCGPCLTKINCETCSNCLNRKTGHQICKFRKCIELRKKTANSTTTLPADHEPVDETVGKHEERSPPNTADQITEADAASPETNLSEASKPDARSTPSPIVCPAKVTTGPPTLKTISITSNEPLSCTSSTEAQNAGPVDCSICTCKVKDDGTVYKHLGVASSVANVRSMLAKRFSMDPEAIRIEQVGISEKEGKNPQGCPIARWVLRRSSTKEKILTVVRRRSGHTCDHAVLVLGIVLWEGIPTLQADNLYAELTNTLNEHATPTARRCETNESKLCACQGTDPDTRGASFSFGCAWSMYHNGCKFARSRTPRKFRLQNQEKEEGIDTLLQNLATQVAQKYKTLAPEAFENQTRHNQDGLECRVGYSGGCENVARPFSGVTCCVDFCAHNHRDKHNMDDGATVVLTLLGKQTVDDDKENGSEQLHSLPCYQLLDENENVAQTNYVIPAHVRKSSLIPNKPSDNNAMPNMPTSSEKNGECPARLPFNGHQETPLGYQYPGYNIPGGQVSGIWNNPGAEFNGSHRNFYGFDESNHAFNGAKPPGIEFTGEGNIPGLHREWGHCVPGYGVNGGMVTHPRFPVNGFHANGFTNGEFRLNGVHSEERRYAAPVISEECTPRKDEAKNSGNGEGSPDDDVTWIDDAMGGVGLALSHGSILVECAKQEVHATTSIQKPNRKSPTRISLVFYQHKQMNFRNHGAEEYRKKLEQKRLDARQAAEINSQLPFDDGYLDMLAEAALSYPTNQGIPHGNQGIPHGLDIANGDSNSRAFPRGVTEQVTPSTFEQQVGGFTQGKRDAIDEGASRSSCNATNNMNDSCQSTRNPASSYPLSEYLRSLKHKETGSTSNGFQEPSPPLYPAYPYTNTLPSPSFFPPLFAVPPRYPTHAGNPFTHAGRGSYQLLNSHHLDQNHCRTPEVNRVERTNDEPAASHSTNHYSVESLLGRKRSHETRDPIEAPMAKQKRLGQNGLSHYGPFPNEPLNLQNHIMGWPYYPDVSLNPKFLPYSPFAPKTIFTGTTTHAIDSLVTMAPFSGTFVSGNYHW